MQSWIVLALLWLSGGHGGGVTNADDGDISKYWAEDFKALGHLYGRTSDKDLYGVTLPPAVTFTVAATKLQGSGLEKTEKFADSDFTQASSTYPYNLNQIINNRLQKKETQQSSTYIGYSDFKPVNHNPDTYNSPKHIEKWEKQKKEFPSVSLSGFKPYFNGGYGQTDTGVQNILNTKTNEGRVVDDGIYGLNKARSKVRKFKGNESSRLVCRAGICRKKSKITNRFHSRPSVKKIKRIVYN